MPRLRGRRRSCGRGRRGPRSAQCGGSVTEGREEPDEVARELPCCPRRTTTIICGGSSPARTQTGGVVGRKGAPRMDAGGRGSSKRTPPDRGSTRAGARGALKAGVGSQGLGVWAGHGLVSRARSWDMRSGRSGLARPGFESVAADFGSGVRRSRSCATTSVFHAGERRSPVIPNRAGPIPNRAGPIPNRAGPIPDRAGPIPNRAGPIPVSAGCSGRSRHARGPFGSSAPRDPVGHTRRAVVRLRDSPVPGRIRVRRDPDSRRARPP